MASGCGGNARTTDGGPADGGRGTGGSGAKDAATDQHMAADRTSAADRSPSMDMRPSSDARRSGDGACGALGQPCCAPGLSCQGDPATHMCSYLLIPNTYVCIHCGDENEPCCPNSLCNSAANVCDQLGASPATCKPCGLTGNPCCYGSTPCSAAGACCSQDLSTRTQGRCVAPASSCTMLDSAFGYGTCVAGTCECGKENEPCCMTNPVCANAADQCMKSPLISTCAACGGPGKPCCPNNTCANGGCCVYDYSTGSLCVAAGSPCQTSPTATCNAGSCGTCGGVGQPCCVSPENVCTAPYTFCPTREMSAICMACGGSGQPCCGPDSVYTTGTGCKGGLACTSTSQNTAGTCH